METKCRIIHLKQKKILSQKASQGTADKDQLDLSIASAWQVALQDSNERAEIAALLGVQESDLDPNSPPFRADIRGAGTFGAEILIALAVGFVVGFAKDFGKGMGSQAGKKSAEALRNLWTDHIRDRASPPGSGRLGPEKEDVEEG